MAVRMVPYTMAVGPPFSITDAMVRPMPSHDDSTVNPKATAGLSLMYRYRTMSACEISEILDHERRGQGDPRQGVGWRSPTLRCCCD